MENNKTAVALINVGTPDSPGVNAVRRYLSQFLNDKYVIDIPWLWRKLLVNLIIVPFRAPKSAKLYQQLWTEKGSPLIFHGNELVEKLQEKLGEEYGVFLSMRYGNPSIKRVISAIKKEGYEKLVVLPLYPQYALSTTKTSIEYVHKQLKKIGYHPEINTITSFYNHPKFIKAFVSQIKKYKPEGYDHIIFSYHGLPNRQVEKLHPSIKSENCSCNIEFPVHGKNCYKAQCYETTRLLVSKMGLKKDSYSVSFQSRLSKNWLTPFTDELIQKLLGQGKKKILVAAPAFVADCLETIIEIGFEYKEVFLEKGGEKLDLVASLNSGEKWVETLENLVKEALQVSQKGRSKKYN